ncbi:hypothetical protein EV645_1148 [Kribbella rubisoli]|uniref:Uncharacterized protein n=1 Tax=Kribbella rubisoli TaxID=3075929 RepID=A0A4V6MF75_9ACTN|nr:hypothetical protein EV645_1148 [Kribbella rubisoli]
MVREAWTLVHPLPSLVAVTRCLPLTGVVVECRYRFLSCRSRPYEYCTPLRLYVMYQVDIARTETKFAFTGPASTLR